MGEAKNIVQGKAPVGTADPDSVIGKLEEVLDDIDTAIQIKQHDCFSEGPEMKAENHFKIGLLRGADGLMRRAQAMLEDYGEGLKDDTDSGYVDDAEAEDQVEIPVKTVEDDVSCKKKHKSAVKRLESFLGKSGRNRKPVGDDDDVA